MESEFTQLAEKAIKKEADAKQILNLTLEEKNAETALQNKKILEIADENGWSVAHTIAATNPKLAIKMMEKQPEALKIKDKNGDSVAHAAAILHKNIALELLTNPKHTETLQIKNNQGVSVEQRAKESIEEKTGFITTITKKDKNT